jgi:hypothetical protein
MALGARFSRWGLGFFIYGVFLTFGIVAHYCVGARWPTGALFMQNITLWWACPWTLSVAAVQAGGLGMVALGVTRMAAARFLQERELGFSREWSLWLCNIGLFGVFAVGYAGYFVFDAIWPGYYYSPIALAKNIWLLGQGLFIAIYFIGIVWMFGSSDQALKVAQRSQISTGEP